MKQYLCGIDIGTSTLKATFLAADGTILGPYRREIVTAFPHPAHAEQDPEQRI